MTLEQSITERKDFYINYIKKLVYTIKSINISKEEANDILMDAYIMVKDNYIGDKAQPTTYLYSVIRFQLLDKNSYISRTYFNNMFVKIDIDTQELENIEDDIPCENDIRISLALIQTKINTEKLYWFDKEIFNLYYGSKLSLRDIEKQTNIPYSSIFVSLNNIKKEINLTKYEQKCLDFIKKQNKLI
jgi:RNA polymerase sigma factor (sigma-70 family)